MYPCQLVPGVPAHEHVSKGRLPAETRGQVGTGGRPPGQVHGLQGTGELPAGRPTL